MLALSPWACILGAFLVLTVPLPWLCAAVLAAAFHELCHFAVIRLVKGSVSAITLGSGGAVMEVCLEGRGRETLAALAGPVGSFSLLAWKSLFPEVALCGLVQGCYNLIPVYPLDGGRILRCLLEFFCPQYRRSVEAAVAAVLLFAMLAAACFLRRGILPAVYVASVVLLRKSPCKQKKIRVQ